MWLPTVAWTILLLLLPSIEPALAMSQTQPDPCPKLVPPPLSPSLEVADLCLG